MFPIPYWGRHEDDQYSVQLSQLGYPHMDEEGKKDVKAQLEYPDEERGIDRLQPAWGLLEGIHF